MPYTGREGAGQGTRPCLFCISGASLCVAYAAIESRRRRERGPMIYDRGASAANCSM